MIFISSWDDGHPLDHRIAALLQERGLRGTFYVPISNSEGRPVMRAAEIRKLAQDGFEIGSHTHDHVYLTRITGAQRQVQIQTGKDALEQILGQSVTGFCYPGGKQPSGIAQLLREAGISHARTVENLRSDARFDRYAIATTLQFYPHRRSTLWRNLARAPRPLMSKMTLIGQIPVDGNAMDDMAGILSTCAQSDGVYHLWGHSWEIEQLGAWGKLARTLDSIAALKPQCMTVDEFANTRIGA